MRREGNKIVLEKKNCVNCQEGTVATREDCPECKGTGRGKRGKVGGCKQCNGFRNHWNHDIRTTCPICNGNYVGHCPETYCDYLPKDIFPSLEFRVYRSNRPQSGNEYLLGFGCVYSCTDYGRSKGMTDEALIAMVKDDSNGVQASKICADDGTICNHIGIFLNNSGYSVRAVFTLDAIDAKLAIALEREKEEYMQVGSAIASNGGNGTMDALYR